jgi:hypothetical protein
MEQRAYVFAKGRPHFAAMIFACATGLLVLLAAAPTFRASDVPVSAIRPQLTTRPSTVPAPTVRRPNANEVDSAWVSQSPAPTISVGGEATLTFRFRNAGTVAWIRGAVSEASLAFIGDDRRFDPRMAMDWPLPSRPATQTESAVAPGELATFTFKVRGMAPGTYRIDLRPTISDVGWLRAEGVYIEVTVR